MRNLHQLAFPLATAFVILQASPALGASMALTNAEVTASNFAFFSTDSSNLLNHLTRVRGTGSNASAEARAIVEMDFDIVGQLTGNPTLNVYTNAATSGLVSPVVTAAASADFSDRLDMFRNVEVTAVLPIFVQIFVGFHGSLTQQNSGATALVVASYQTTLPGGATVFDVAERRFRVPTACCGYEQGGPDIGGSLLLEFDVSSLLLPGLLNSGTLRLGLRTDASSINDGSATGDFFGTMQVRTINFTDAAGNLVPGMRVVGDSGAIYPVNVETSAIPEPSTLALVLLGATITVFKYVRRPASHRPA